MKIEWSLFAIEDRDTIFDYIEQDNPHAAISLDEHIEEQTKKLLQFPECGRPGRIEGTREIILSNTPYIIAYRVKRDTIRILRVLHGALQWPQSMSD